MSEERTGSQWWLPVGLVVLLAFAIGIGGGSLLSPVISDLFGTPEETAPLETPDNVAARADLIAGEGPKASQLPATTAPKTEAESATAGSPLLQPPAQAAPPEQDSRSAERRLLALDSPLTPPVAEIGARIRQQREDKLAAQTPTAETPTEADTRASSPTGNRQAADAARLHVLARGAVIPAVLQTPIDSALPGLVRAQVAEDVYDSQSGAHILIPRGARLIGTYGQAGPGAGGGGARRLFVEWSDLRLPDGTPIDLGQFSTLGPDGASGLKGRRSTGFWQALGAAVLFDLAGNATAILTNQQAQPQSDLGALAGAALGNATSRVASDYIGALLNQGPRFRIKAGSFMNVLVGQDMSLPAIRSGEVLR